MSKLFSLNASDLFKGFLMAMLTAIATAVYTQLSADVTHLPTLPELKTIGLNAFGVGILYLAKNFLTNSAGKIAKKE